MKLKISQLTIEQQLLRERCIEQEATRFRDRASFHVGRIERGTADDEDRALADLWTRIADSIEALA